VRSYSHALELKLRRQRLPARPVLRERLVAHYERAGRAVQFRNREISRLEGLSDAVFGFAITLLIVSLEVPKTSSELIATGFPPTSRRRVRRIKDSTNVTASLLWVS